MRLKVFILAGALMFCFALNAVAQSAARENYTGTMVGIGGRRSVTRTFTLAITGRSSNAEVGRDVALLAEAGQDALLTAIRDRDLGHFSLGGQLGRRLNFVTETTLANGDRKLMILFERWMDIYELRYGSRSLDYPFGYVELIVDRNGRGEGTFIPAARVRFNSRNEIEVENFGIYPARLFGVRRRS
ncbi:MAG TPA: hypothetical protein VGW32_08550 [Pyrinomonadaceae bacterium]|nr:hypothetical protein [Pyrinomonadaceae bacterium]